MSWRKYVPFLVLPALLARSVQAHCPLCTMGVAAAAGGAVWLGISKTVIGLFIGAFAVSTGWWVSKYLKKDYVPYQKVWLILLSFLLTVLPLLPLLKEVFPWYISFAGEYGSLLNRTYVINGPLFSSILGGLLVSLAPGLSRKITALRQGKIIPFQGVLLTISLLLIAGAVIQMVI